MFKFWLFYFQNTLDLLEHVHLNEVGGAAGIDHGLSSDHQEWGVDSGLDFLDFPDLLLEAERSSLEFYKVWNLVLKIYLTSITVVNVRWII